MDLNIPIVVMDWETFYDAQYSLSKLTTEEYIRSPQFETIGCSIQMPTWDKPRWFVGESVRTFIEANRAELEQCAMLAHHTAFDGAIAAWQYGLVFRLYLDTMSMAQPLFGFTSGVSLAKLGETLNLGTKGNEVIHALGKHLRDFMTHDLAAYGGYCINDNVMCRRIFEYLLPLTPPRELASIDQVLRCFIEPRIQLDEAILQEYYEGIVLMKQTQYVWAGNMLGIEPEEVKTAIMSNPQLAVLLEELGVDPPTKLSPATGKVAFAFAKTDDEFLELKDHEDARVQALVECRLGGKSTIAETRALRLIGCAKRGWLPVMLKYYAAHPGRLGGGDAINMQNIPRHKFNAAGELVERSRIRDAMMAPPQHEFVSGDLSQIEARIIAYIAGQDDVVDVFRAFDAKQGPDIYCVTASSVLGKTVTKADKNDRQLGKVIRLSLPYGVGVDKLIKTAKKDGVIINPTVGATLHKRFRDASPMIIKLWKDAELGLKALIKGEYFEFGRDGCIKVKADGMHLPSGRVLRYPGLEMEMSTMGPQYSYLNRKKRVKIYGAKLVENITQALAGSVCADAWLRIRNKQKVVMQVHDELVSIAHTSIIDEACAQMEAALSTPVKWLPGMPVACEVHHAFRYGDCK
jgi:hypothetical protein